MKARINRFYWEEIEEIIINISDKINEIEEIENQTVYCTDKKKALLILLSDLENIAGGIENDKIY